MISFLSNRKLHYFIFTVYDPIYDQIAHIWFPYMSSTYMIYIHMICTHMITRIWFAHIWLHVYDLHTYDCTYMIALIYGYTYMIICLQSYMNSTYMIIYVSTYDDPYMITFWHIYGSTYDHMCVLTYDPIYGFIFKSYTCYRWDVIIFCFAACTNTIFIKP